MNDRSLSALDAYARALPFEHLLRRRPPDEALARWDIERNAYSTLDRPVVGLAVDCSGPADHLVDTLATWRLQTWPATALVCLDAGPAAARLVADWFPGATLMPASQPVPPDVDWVVPAVPGDLLHPSLAGIVAMHALEGAQCVAWDWFTARRHDRSLELQARHRGPWRDAIAELGGALRPRTYAVPADAWPPPGAGGNDARLALPSDARGRVHPEPLSIVGDRGSIAQAAGGAVVPNPWPHEFEAGPAGLQPVSAAAGVSVIILFRDRPELTIAAIESVVRQRFRGELQLVLVDNQSTESSRSMLGERLARLPSRVTVTMLRHDAPFNHSRQCNLGAAAAAHPVLLFLNNDAALLDVDAIDSLARFALLPGVATVGARVVGPDGATLGGGFLARRQPGAEYNSPVEEAKGAIGELTRMTVGNTFACAAVSTGAFRALGGLDDVRFPNGYNDVDFCLRAAKAGWHHVNLAGIRISHAVGASRGRTDEIAQKVRLRMEHGWLAARSLQEWAEEPVQSPATQLPHPESPNAPEERHEHDS